MWTHHLLLLQQEAGPWVTSAVNSRPVQGGCMESKLVPPEDDDDDTINGEPVS